MTLFDPAYFLAAALAMSGAPLEKPVEAREVTCLALNVYHEARGEDVTGQLAVAHVTLNRTADPRFPDDVCGVVTQQHRNVCQFSWFCREEDWRTDEGESFRRALRVAVEALTGVRPDPTKGATHFISSRIGVPDWARRMRHTVTIGGHRFFRG
jgi:spore germination cell wall hydrolase CwlJ-like protein